MLSKRLSEQIVDRLFTQIPEFAEFARTRIDPEFLKNGYLVFGPFGTFLSDWITDGKEKDLIDRAYSYINDICNNSVDKEVEKLLKVTFFENMIDKKKAIITSKANLKDNALVLFEEVLNGPLFAGGIYAT